MKTASDCGGTASSRGAWGWILVLAVTAYLSVGAFPSQAQTPYFTDVTPDFSGINLFNGKWGDYDNDDDLDLFIGGSLCRNDGNLVFTKVADLAAGARNAVGWSDYDGDGDLDLAMAGSGFARIYRSDGSGVFVNIDAGLMQNLSYPALAWGDHDNDRRPDLVLSGYLSGSRYTLLYHNNSDGTFSEVKGTGLPRVDEGAFAWGDYNGDGRLDLLVTGGIGPSTFLSDVYRNNGNGTFTAAGAGMTGIREGSAAWGDFDNDGDLDALVTGFYYGSYILNVYRNNGNGTFTDLNLGLQGTAFGEGQWVDFDGDGFLDIFVCGCIVNYCDASIARIYRNQGNGTFADAGAGLSIPPNSAYPGSWGDFDGDGDLDLLLNRLYRNNSLTSNSPPSTPAGLAADFLPDNNVLLRWNRSADSETINALGLSYAVRMGTSPGGLDIVSPHSNPATGFRRLPERGPVSTNAILIRDLPLGTYYWSVQAIDAGFAGSAFAVENTFTITNTRPVISAISGQFTVPGHATPPLAFTVSDLETPADALIVNGYSTNTTLVPNDNIVFGGSGSNRTMTVTPVAGRSGTSTIILSVTDGGGLSATSRFDLVVQAFVEVSAGLPSDLGMATAWGDYDDDGDLDIVIAGPQYGYTAVYRNTNGFFTNQNFNLPSAAYYLTPTDLAWLDFDNDGDLDLAEPGWLSSGYSPSTLRFRNNFPTNSFTSIGTSLPGIGVTNVADGAMAWADYDNDGDMDVLLAGDPNTYHGPDAFTALYRDDRGMFTNSGVALPALVKGAATWGDYDNDGDLDLLFAGQTGNDSTNSVTKLFRNDGGGVFTEIAASFPGITDCALAFGEMDNDGRLDIAMAGTATNGVPLTRIYRNLGNGSFTNVSAVLIGVAYASLAWGDSDNDGFADLVVSGSTNTSRYYIPEAVTTTVYRNLGGVGFTNIGGLLPGVYMQNASWGDYDGDGDLDLLAGTRLLRNNWNIFNAPPAAPTGLSVASTTNDSLLFSWLTASDAETANPLGLRYNLRLGTTPGGAEIVSPHADPATGQLRVPHFGNAGSATFWPIRSLANGTYYWSVQAIDSALAGSPFAAEQSFTVSRPVLSVITNRAIFPNTAIAPIPFTVSDAETAAENLVLAVTSSDNNLVPQAGLSIMGAGTNRLLSIAPTANRSGMTTITLTATDEDGETSSTSFQLVLERFADIAAGLSPLVASVAWGDYDNDGDLDLARGTTIYRNDDNGVFADIGLGLTGLPSATAAWGDYDGDGDLDWLVYGAGFGGIFRNDGNDSFSNVLPTLSGNPNSSLVWGDLDNDGDLDFLRAYSNGTSPYRNIGSGVFTNFAAGLPLVYPGSVALGDFDKDGDLDILLAGNGYLRIFRNDGKGAFTDLVAGLPSVYYASVAWGDFDNDGHLDFAVCGSTNSAPSGVVTRIYRNTTNAAPTLMFTNMYPVATQGPAGVWKGAVAWGDMDNDGDLDLLATGESTNGFALTRVYRNDGGKFADSGHTLPGLRNSFGAWGDFDNDGNLDLALSGILSTGAAVSRVYRNFPSGSPNVPPGAPASLTNVVIGKSVRMSWAAASDANQSGGLTYNLRVGTAPGAADIVSPMADSDGLRRLPAIGNANGRLSWTLTNLAGGTYYWSVQAIDASFAGSAFALEKSLIISNQLPSGTDRSLTLAEDTWLNITLEGADPDGDPLAFRVVEPPALGIITGTPPQVTYRPLTNYFGFDQFKFVVNDRTVDSEPAPIFLEITPVADVDEVSLSLEREAGGEVRLWLGGEPWQAYLIEASEDLVHWVMLTNALSTNLPVVLTDADAAQFSRRFYRATGQQIFFISK